MMRRTVSMEGTLLTTVIKAQEGQDIATCNILNAFVQTHVEETDKDGNQTIMKIRESVWRFSVRLIPSIRTTW